MKIKKHLWKFALGTLVVAIPAVALTSCGGEAVGKSKTFAELVVSDDTSELRDKSFSESTYNGWRNFMVASNVTNQFGNPDNYDKETLDMPEINSGSKDLDLAKGYWRRPSANRENTFRQIFNNGTNLIIAPGFNHKESIEKVAPGFKNKGFLLLDSGVDATKGDFTNVASFTFRAEQSGFLAGIATAEFLNKNKDVFTTLGGDDGQLKVGGFVGSAFPSTTDFLAGFQAGIIAYNLKVKSTTNSNKTEVQWVSLGQDIGNYASGGFGVGQGSAISQRLINDLKVDAIIPIAGPQTNDAISVITGGSRPVIVVGVDSEQENISQIQKQFTSKQLGNKKLLNADGSDMASQNIIQFSAVKKLDEAVYQTLTAIFNKTTPNNSTYPDTNHAPVQGFGYNNIGTLSNKTVGVSKAGLQWVREFDNNWVTGTGISDYVFSPEGGIYENDSYKNLESVGVLYDDALTGLTAIGDLTSKNQVAAPKFIDDTNRVVGKLDNNNPPATLNKKNDSVSLDGSSWTLKNPTLPTEEPKSTSPKRYEI